MIIFKMHGMYVNNYVMLYCTAGSLSGMEVITLYSCSKNVTLEMAGLPAETCT